ncbi:PREDICTED: uncharacterized protein LOC109150536 [Ipomoea nil]|uniref:uncharacterized protein LOC109150536 n=1 Tax=Ipomoea nil TaxID=35883 RepID=UPI000900D351|nr:PREDICTED: uncharacterized protein LOC109150536 [Ipomoea nil]
MSLHLHFFTHHCHFPSLPNPSLPKFHSLSASCRLKNGVVSRPATRRRLISSTKTAFHPTISASLDLTEDNIKQVLVDARTELAQLFDTEVGITGRVELAEVDGPYVKISLSGKFWHKRSTVLARLGNYLKQRIPEILEVDIEDEKQLDDSPASF